LQVLAFQLFQVVMLSSLGLLVAGATAITYFTAVACIPVIPIIPAVSDLPAKKFLGFLHKSLPHESFTQPYYS
jgi:hypothetical protein